MKIQKLSFTFLVVIIVAACNNSETQSAADAAKVNSLQKEVIDLHNIAMPKSMKIPSIEKKLRSMLDSIGKLPVKAQEAAMPLSAKLNEALNELGYATVAMDKWMIELNLDSAKNDLQKRIQYFTAEKIRVGKVKDVVLSSLEKADSLIKSRF